MTQEGFEEYLYDKYGKSSGTVSSYIAAIHLIDEMFKKDDVFNLNGLPMISIENTDLLTKIKDFVYDQQALYKKGQQSYFSKTPSGQTSYPEKGFCSAAINQLFNYHKREKNNNDIERFANIVNDNVVMDNISRTLFETHSVISSIKSTGLLYDDNLIQRYAYSLLTKPFVILSGLAGSGKTQLALAFAKALVEDEKKQMCIVSVGADWTNREPLLGYPNAFKSNEYVKPDSGVLDLLIECNKPENSSKPFFLILDEMNLSYVERYFADFLSSMESHEPIPLWKVKNNEVPESVALPKNLFVIGTINVDETTYMFSPKVLDRASVIEFKVSEDDMENFLDKAPNVDVNIVIGKASNMAEDFVRIASETKEIDKEANDVLKKFFKHLKTVNAEFGYRTATEIGRFISLSKKTLYTDNAIDAAIVQKLLPKLHGSRKKIVPVLKELWKLCGAKNEIEEQDSLEFSSDIKYPLTADKVLRMYNCAIDNGFTSFAEA